MKIIEEKLLVPVGDNDIECGYNSDTLVRYRSCLTVEIEGARHGIVVYHAPQECTFLLYNEHFRYEIKYRMRTLLMKNLRHTLFGEED